MPTPPPIPPYLPQLPPPRRNSRKSLWLLWLLPVILLLVLVVAGVIVRTLFYNSSSGALSPSGQVFLPKQSAPPGWKNASFKATPPESAFYGTWRPGEPGRHLRFADGTPNTLAPDQTLVLLPDHTFRFTRQGVYDGQSRLICLRSDTGSWSIKSSPGYRSEIILNANFDSIRIDKTVIPDYNEDKATEESIARAKLRPPSEFMEQKTEQQIADELNASNCSATAHRDSEIYDWRIATAPDGRLGIFRDAPGHPYESTLIPTHIVKIEQVLYEHDRP